MAFKFQSWIIGILLISLAASLGGCSQGEWSSVWVGLTTPSPGAYEYYYASAYRSYYCYYPNQGWQYFPGQPPQGAVIYNGSVGYLPPPGPAPSQIQFYYDRNQQAYYYHGPQNHWHYLPGRPPQDAQQWRGRAPGRRELPSPPAGWRYRGRRQLQQQQQQPNNYQQQGNGQYQNGGNGDRQYRH